MMSTEQKNPIALWTNGSQARLAQLLSVTSIHTLTDLLVELKPQQNYKSLQGTGLGEGSSWWTLKLGKLNPWFYEFPCCIVLSTFHACLIKSP